MSLALINFLEGLEIISTMVRYIVTWSTNLDILRQARPHSSCPKVLSPPIVCCFLCLSLPHQRLSKLSPGKSLRLCSKRTCEMMQDLKDYTKNLKFFCTSFQNDRKGDDCNCDRIWEGRGKDVEIWTGRERKSHAELGGSTRSNCSPRDKGSRTLLRKAQDRAISQMN